jgi:hypothetical protein
MPSIRGRSPSTSGSVRRQASFTAARNIRHDTAKPAAVTDMARPELITASTSWFRSRPVDGHGAGPARWTRRTRAWCSPFSPQYQRYLDQSTSTGPATGISRIR